MRHGIGDVMGRNNGHVCGDVMGRSCGMCGHVCDVMGRRHVCDVMLR